jgi:hypothetical protein
MAKENLYKRFTIPDAHRALRNGQQWSAALWEWGFLSVETPVCRIFRRREVIVNNYLKIMSQGDPLCWFRVQDAVGALPATPEGLPGWYEVPIHVTNCEAYMKECPVGIREIRIVRHPEAPGFTLRFFMHQDRELAVAEIKLKTEDQEYPTPDWLGEDVSGLKTYGDENIATRLWRISSESA